MRPGNPGASLQISAGPDDTRQVATAIRPTTEALDGDDFARDRDAEEVVRLDLLRRLSMGAAHTLNNAFTGILGETLCLLDDRKDDPAVVEACNLIQNEVERCARLTRLVAMRAQARQSLIEEADVGSLLRGAESLLRETVSRSLAIECEIPAPGLCVRGSAEDCELLLLSLTLGVVRDHVGGGTLRIAVGTREHDVDLVVALQHAEQSTSRTSDVRDARWERTVGGALARIATRIGARIVDANADGVCLRLSRSQES